MINMKHVKNVNNETQKKYTRASNVVIVTSHQTRVSYGINIPLPDKMFKRYDKVMITVEKVGHNDGNTNNKRRKKD